MSWYALGQNRLGLMVQAICLGPHAMLGDRRVTALANHLAQKLRELRRAQSSLELEIFQPRASLAQVQCIVRGHRCLWGQNLFEEDGSSSQIRLIFS